MDVLNKGDFSVSAVQKDYGQELEFSWQNKSLKGFLPLLGHYNTENFGLALMTLCHHFGPDFFPDERVFKEFSSPPGRMEMMLFKKEPIAYIDYSHTPDSLKKSLQTLKKIQKKIILVFGCGGNRDKDKRPQMGLIASEGADFTFITSDNPREEDQGAIMKDISRGFKGGDYLEVKRRGEAIRKALDKALSDDAIVLIAGKGHEKTQEIMGEKMFFSDVQEVEDWVNKNEG